MNKIELPVHGITVTIEMKLSGKLRGSVTCSPDLYETCPKCGQKECIWSCDGAHIGEVETDDMVSGRLAYNGAADGILEVILAHAVAGIDIESSAYLEGIETALQNSS